MDKIAELEKRIDRAWHISNEVNNPQECAARLGDFWCCLDKGHPGSHRDGVATWEPWELWLYTK